MYSTGASLVLVAIGGINVCALATAVASTCKQTSVKLIQIPTTMGAMVLSGTATSLHVGVARHALKASFTPAKVLHFYHGLHAISRDCVIRVYCGYICATIGMLVGSSLRIVCILSQVYVDTALARESTDHRAFTADLAYVVRVAVASSTPLFRLLEDMADELVAGMPQALVDVRLPLCVCGYRSIWVTGFVRPAVALSVIYNFTMYFIGDL